MKDTTIVKALMSFESKNPEELRRFLDHHVDYLIDLDDNRDVISRVFGVTSYDENEKYDAEKLRMIASILKDVLEKEPSDEELDYDDDAIELYSELHNLKEALENIGFY